MQESLPLGFLSARKVCLSVLGGKHQANLVGCFVKACYNNNITDVWTAETDVVRCVGNCGVCSGVPAVMSQCDASHQ